MAGWRAVGSPVSVSASGAPPRLRARRLRRAAHEVSRRLAAATGRAKEPAAVAIHCGLALLPLRMAYDAFVEKITPPPPAIAMTAAIVGAGFFLKK